MKKSILLKRTAAFMAVCILFQALFPPVTMALTGGPSQPEVTGFQPIGASNMVDLFTGDFSYNIPLLDVDGYPINISYSSNPSMDAEASWVGLGWSLNPGAINRNLRGLPDDFKDEEVKKEFNIREDRTVGVSGGPGFELFGGFGLSASLGVFHNTYNGFGIEAGLTPTLSIGKINGGETATQTPSSETPNATTFTTMSSEPEEGVTLGLGLNYNSQSGLNVQPSIGLLNKNKKDRKQNFGLLANYNSVRGLKDLTINGSVQLQQLKKNRTSNIKGDANFLFGDFTHFPASLMPLMNEGVNFHVTGGAEFIGGHPNFKINGYFTNQRLLSSTDIRPAFGYLYAQDGQDNPYSLQDFNREKEVAFREQNPILPLTYGTYDIFLASGQGLSGQFRTARNDIGLFREPGIKNQGFSGNLGVELGVGNAFHTGADLVSTKSNTTKGLWQNQNNMLPRMPFTESEEIYEATYFKSSGEKIITNIPFFNRLGGSDPINIDIEKKGLSSQANSRFTQSHNILNIGTIPIHNQLHRSKTQREKRNQVFSYLTAKEATNTALDKKIKSYPANKIVISSCNNSDINEINRVSENRKDHHISEVTVTQPDGSRYVYGIPVYNTLQREVSFNINPHLVIENPEELGETLKPYTPEVHNTVNNEEGKDYYFDAQNIPPYAHSYLLTAVLSPDYVDLTGDGVSDDDLGNGVKLNYSRVYSDNEPYKWRSPYQENAGRYQEASKAKDNDDKASYVYGEKEIWYLHSIESRTMLAQFYLSNRNDSYGVKDEDGGKGNQPLKKLDKIELYSKAELIENSIITNEFTPIKIVHFDYNYELCNGIPNGDSGKLTLKKIWFTYGNSDRGALNAYHFGYATGSQNPLYNIDNYDRWGNFKQLPKTGNSINPNYPELNNFPSNADFPYLLQDAVIANDNANAWNLKEIELPSGGKIQVEYEADDYAYVQNKRAGQMFFIQGFKNDLNETENNELYENINKRTIESKKYVIVKLMEDLTDPSSTNELLKRYFEDVKQIYFHCLVNLDNPESTIARKDYVKGYLEFDKEGIQFNADDNTIAIPIDLVRVKNNDYHPITHSAFQNLRLYHPEIIFPGYDVSDMSVGKAITKLFSVGNEIKNIIKGFHLNSANKEWARTVDLNKSWIRLANPNFKKLGGGSRVKKVAISDEWDAITGDGISAYGQEYTYEKEIELDGKQVTISSGVASYEPMIGNEENLWRVPIDYKFQASATVDYDLFAELPVGEAFFPAPMVGYESVKIQSFGQYKNNTPKHDVGYTTNEFYTAKDFPVRTDYSIIEPVKRIANPVLRFFKINLHQHMAVSQGFVVEINDMHGKPKEEAIYDNNGSLISSTKYFYKVENQNASEKQLVNEVDVLKKDGSIEKVNIGLELDVWQDMREENNVTEAVGVKGNVDGFLAFIIPIVLPIPFPSYHKSSKTFRSAVTTKLIKRIGLLDEVVVTENGSTISTKNQLYDAETGNVLMTRTQNEFNDNMYQFTYPAHWAYDGMGQAYQNIGALFDNVDIDNGKIPNTFNTDYIVSGDEIFVEKILSDGTYEPLAGKYTIVQTNIDNFVVMNGEGEVLEPTGAEDNSYRFKIIRSGRRNQSGMPIGAIASRQAPLNVAETQLEINTNKEILNVSATEFTDDWQMECATFIDECGDEFTQIEYINPYQEGVFGNWRPKRSFAYHTSRIPFVATTNTNIQNDGRFINFQPFWYYDSNQDQWARNTNPNWVAANEMTIYDQRGNELENLDAIGNYSAAIFGYNNTRATAIASNAQRCEIAFDGFEDYHFDSECTPIASNNFSIYNADEANLSDLYAHSGKYAMSILPGQAVEVSTPLKGCSTVNGSNIDKTFTIKLGHLLTNDTHIINGCASCLPKFTPLQNQSYFVTLWVATHNSITCGAPPQNAKITIYFDEETDLFHLEPVGPVIDGWQRMAGTFTIPANASSIYMKLFNDNIDKGLYVDDFRIHPKNSNMVSYVYDPHSLRLMAQLDDNNYASFYEYDDEGILVRTKRETEKGIVTIQEARTVLAPNN